MEVKILQDPIELSGCYVSFVKDPDADLNNVFVEVYDGSNTIAISIPFDQIKLALAFVDKNG